MCDGRYIIFPEGGTWEYRRIRGGEVVSQTQEANLSTHVTARDHLSWLGDLDFGALPVIGDEGRCAAILVAAGMAGSPEQYVICEVHRAAPRLKPTNERD